MRGGAEDTQRRALTLRQYAVPGLATMLGEFQTPEAADKLSSVQAELDETKVIMHETIQNVLTRGEKLDTLVDNTTELSSQARAFYKQSKKANQCCVLQ